MQEVVWRSTWKPVPSCCDPTHSVTFEHETLCRWNSKLRYVLIQPGGVKVRIPCTYTSTCWSEPRVAPMWMESLRMFGFCPLEKCFCKSIGWPQREGVMNYSTKRERDKIQCNPCRTAWSSSKPWRLLVMFEHMADLFCNCGSNSCSHNFVCKSYKFLRFQFFKATLRVFPPEFSCLIAAQATQAWSHASPLRGDKKRDGQVWQRLVDSSDSRSNIWIMWIMWKSESSVSAVSAFVLS